MKFIFHKCTVKCLLLYIATLSVNTIWAQTCPPAITTTLSAYSNTYFPGMQATVNAGSISVVIGAAAYGTIPVSAGDVLLIIQMQGAQFISANDNTYGDGVSGRGYLNNAQLYAGNMEYVIATNAVPLSGGTLSLQTGTVNSYKKAAFGTDGQYTYQVIRIPLYYNLILDNDIIPPNWDGATGGVLVLAVTNSLDMNNHAISATMAGFRGGGGVQLFNGIGTNQDYASISPTDANISAGTGRHASKGEGISGTPRLINNNWYDFLRRFTEEGYPGGSFGRGAPGNAGGGGSDDGNTNNSRNSGGGGGGNGGTGGKGGNSFYTVGPYGGFPGAPFAQSSSMRLVMGGGGGAGDSNDGTGTPNDGLASSGAPGGGIIIINANAIISPGLVIANGTNAVNSIQYDAAGGGGGGGSVLINAHSGHANLTVFAHGGNGGSNFYNDFTYPPQHGPGGGGGGGVIYTNGTLGTASVLGGMAGTTNSSSGLTNYGAQAGAGGISVTGPVMPFPSGCMVLPMKFLTTNGKKNGAQVQINWEVADEADLTNYIIERSYNGYEFTTAGIVGNKPNNETISKYSFSDALAGKEATTYYRIKAQDAYGQTFFSKVITIQTVLSKDILDISPVPARRYTMIKWTSTSNSKLNVTLFDVSGRFVLCRQYPVKKGENELLLTNLEALPAGIYFIKASDGTSYRNGKLRIQQ